MFIIWNNNIIIIIAKKYLKFKIVSVYNFAGNVRSKMCVNEMIYYGSTCKFVFACWCISPYHFHHYYADLFATIERMHINAYHVYAVGCVFMRLFSHLYSMQCMEQRFINWPIAPLQIGGCVYICTAFNYYNQVENSINWSWCESCSWHNGMCLRAALSGRPGAGQQITRVLLP